jgi:aldehyde:ferredoxin oxidoreductase
MNSVFGVTGKVARVNLGAGTARSEPVPADRLEMYIGGRGLGARFLYDEVAADADPLSAGNKLVFMNGPLGGSLVTGSNKINLAFKSPLTGTYSYSLCGGHWGPELKFAGLDGLIVEGAAEEPVYLWINDGRIEVRPAAGLWGKTIPETEKALRAELGGDERIQIACIGPAGEKLNRYACITAGWYREFGRGGCGAVMGAKKLKAIAVRGTGDIRVHDPKSMMEFAETLYRDLKAHPKAKDRRTYGTNEMLKTVNDLGYFCTRNFTGGYFPEGARIDGPRMREDIVVGDASCYACPVACGKRSRAGGAFGSVLLEGPEFETIGLVGANCGVSDWDAIVKATQICDEYGFDTMNAGGAVALAMECFEKGILTAKDTGGLELRFGSGPALVEALRMIAERRGIGDILAEGIKAAAEHFGAPELGMHSKGQGFAVYDPRGCKGMALTYALSPKGAHHMYATTMGPEMAAKNTLSIEGKGKLQRDQQFSMCIADSIAVCSTLRVALSVKALAQAFTMATGVAMDEQGLLTAAERIINLERMYNARMGLSRKDDTLPERFLREPLPEGYAKGSTVDLDPMLDEYYALMGWDSNGIPTMEKLSELGLQRHI